MTKHSSMSLGGGGILKQTNTRSMRKWVCLCCNGTAHQNQQQIAFGQYYDLHEYEIPLNKIFCAV